MNKRLDYLGTLLADMGDALYSALSDYALFVVILGGIITMQALLVEVIYTGIIQPHFYHKDISFFLICGALIPLDILWFELQYRRQKGK